MKRNLLFLVVACAFSVTAAWGQQEQSVLRANSQIVSPLVLYDDFNGRWIDPAKWYDLMGTANLLEVDRELSPSHQGQGNNRRLHLYARAYGVIGSQGVDYGQVGLQFQHPASIKEVSFSVVVNSASISGCQDNTETGAAVANFSGTFFNYQGQDISASIMLLREESDPSAPLRVRALFNSDDWSIAEVYTLGFVSLGQAVKLRLKWDQANKLFAYQLNSDPEAHLAYGITDTNPPNGEVKVLSVWQGTPRCPSLTPGGAVIDAYFDNVYVNSQ